MLVVVDANVVVQIILAGGELGPLAPHRLIAPPLLASEVTSVLCEMTYRLEIPPEPGRLAAGRLAALPIQYERPEGLFQQAFDIARSLGWAKSYDAEYIALAKLRNAALLTLDERMRRGAGHIVEMLTLQNLDAP